MPGEVTDNYKRCYDEYHSALNTIFQDAFSKNAVQFIYTILRVEGVHDEGWDDYVEAEEALIDFSKGLQKKKGRSAYRHGLLIYCHAVEMSAPYDILANLFRVIGGENYLPFPYLSFAFQEGLKGKAAHRRYEYPSDKLGKMEALAKAVSLDHVFESLWNTFYNNEMRNAFYHSSYIFTDKEFHYYKKRTAKSIPLEEINELLTRCFSFYRAFFDVYWGWRRSFRNKQFFPKQVRCLDYKVLEVITNKKEGLIGFRYHISNGTTAEYTRSKKGAMGINVMLGNSGVELWHGDLASLQNEWIVRGKVFREKDKKYNPDGHWRPLLVRPESATEIMKSIDTEKDPILKGLLFYQKATGHESIEFVFITDDPKNIALLAHDSVHIHHCSDLDKDGLFVYDCVFFINSRSKAALARATQWINNTAKIAFPSSNTKLIIKYSQEPLEMTEEGKIVFFMNNPRHILYATDISNQSWEIRWDWL